MLLFVAIMQANVLLHGALHLAIGTPGSSDQFDVPHVSIAHLCDCAPSSTNSEGCDPNVAGAVRALQITSEAFRGDYGRVSADFIPRLHVGPALARAPPPVLLV